MSGHELLALDQVTPGAVATDLLGKIKTIESLLSDSQEKVLSIEQRGWWKSMVASSTEDLVAISKSQNKVNDLMLVLVQEVIALNTLSYAFLASVIGELEQRAREGWVDAEGNFQELSSTGRDFAEKARGIFLKIAEGSKETYKRIESGEQKVERLTAQVRIQDEQIGRLQVAMERKSEVAASDLGRLSRRLQILTGVISAIAAVLAGALVYAAWFAR